LASEQEEWAESMAGIEARQQGALNPEVEVRRRANDEPAVLTATHPKRDKRGERDHGEDGPR